MSSGRILKAGMKTIAPALLAVGIALAPAGSDSVALQSADQIIVHKKDRRLELMRNEQVIGSYGIKLGLDPRGPKMREGDFRTPEGRYRLTRRNPNSEFFLSIQISYPSESDLQRARRNGWPPGGLIMIHGLPNKPKHPLEYYEGRDWTDGCIAVSNSDMVEIWLLTGYDTPIEIRP